MRTKGLQRKTRWILEKKQYFSQMYDSSFKENHIFKNELHYYYNYFPQNIEKCFEKT